MTGTVMFIAEILFELFSWETDHITLSVAGKLIWEGTESKKTALRLRSGVFNETNKKIRSTYKTTTILTDNLSNS